jgi:hypothetical protein
MRQIWVGAFLAATLSLATARAATNLLSNGSFEQVLDGATAEWQVDAAKAGASIAVAGGAARSGAAALKIVNRTPLAPHVYSSLTQTVKIKAETTYTLSCYVRTGQGGRAWIGGGADWQYRFGFPEVAADWQRVVGTFTSAAREDQFTVRILTESPTEGLWVDDVQLEEGTMATDVVYVPPLAPGEGRLTLTPLTVGPNLVPNPSFEDVEGQRPRGWRWDPRNTDATLELETTPARLGKVSLRFTNGTPFAAHVYGWFGVEHELPVKPATVYTLSASVRSDADTVAWFGGGTGWTLRVRIPNTQGRWERVSRVFTTGDQETAFPLMVVSESPTPGFWLDGLEMREGVAALPEDVDPETPRDAVHIGAEPPEPVMYRGGLVETRWAAALYPPGEWAFTSGVFKASGVVSLASANGAELEVVMADSAGKELSRAVGACPPDSRLASFAVSARLEAPAAGPVLLSARLRRGAALLAEGRQPVTLVTPTRIEARLAEVEVERERLRALTTGLESRGVGAYARVTLTVLENFVPWAREDMLHDRADRAWHAAETMLTMARRASAEAEAVTNGQAPALVVPRYETSPLEIQGASFVGARVTPTGERERGPVFFTGYGHFSQVRQDIEKLPAYGCNLCQVEFGPSSVLVAEDRVDERPIRDFLAVCDRAAKAGVAVNLLLSPHYFPPWALDKWPQLRECRGGFFGYCVHAPEARDVIERFLRTTIPLIKDHPALHSLCLSNEPISNEVSQCRHVAGDWGRWLHTKYGRVEALNQRWGSTYAALIDVPVPKPFAPGAMSVDFVRFNQEQFAGFHQWMAEVIHEMAPRVPVHAKIMMGAHFMRHEHGIWSVDPELFGDLSQIHGNDCYCMVTGQGEWANGWQLHQMAYDFQRSMGDKPVFNSENHVIADRDHSVIPADHLYSTLWQGALHGQSATTLWVWQRSFDHTSDLEGSIIQRPDVAEAVGRCGLDLLRLADEMAALQRQPPQVLLYWSQSSVIQREEHYPALSHCYRQANFLGVPLGFVTDRQLERYGSGGEAPHGLAQGAAKVLLVPEAGCVSAAALAGLGKAAASGVRVVRAGPCFAADEYGIARATVPTLGEELPGYGAKDRGTFAAFWAAAAAWELSPALTVTETDGKPAYGVEIRSAMAPGERLVASLCNHTREPRTVVLRRRGTPVASTKLQSGRPLEPEVQLPVLRPVLLQVR